jgi:hypothetical protein
MRNSQLDGRASELLGRETEIFDDMVYLQYDEDADLQANLWNSLVQTYDKSGLINRESEKFLITAQSLSSQRFSQVQRLDAS